MPAGPKGRRRPADAIGIATRVARIATGEEIDDALDDGKHPAAKTQGAKGGAARATRLNG